MDQDKFDLLKSHIDAFTRKDGAVVAAHDNKVVKKAKKEPAPPASEEDIEKTKQVLIAGLTNRGAVDNPLSEQKLDACARYLHGKSSVDPIKVSNATGVSIGMAQRLRKMQLDEFKANGLGVTQTQSQRINAFLSQKH